MANIPRTLTRHPAAPVIVWLLLCGLMYLGTTTESTTLKLVAVVMIVPIALGLVLLAFWRIVATAAHVGSRIRTVPAEGGGGVDAPSPD